MTRAAAHYSAGVRRPAWVGSAGLRPAPGLRRQAWGTIGSLRLTAASTSRSASLSRATQAHPSSHEGVGVPTGCLAGPASMGNASVVDSVEGEGQGVRRFALRIPDEKRSEPEHCRRVQIAVSGLLELPGNHTWEFVIWNVPSRAGARLEGRHRRSPIRWAVPDGRLWPDVSIAGERRGEMSGPAEMWKCGEFVNRTRGSRRRSVWFTLRSAGLTAFLATDTLHPDSYSREYRLRRRGPQSDRADWAGRGTASLLSFMAGLASGG